MEEIGEDIKASVDLAAGFIQRSIDVHNGRGSAHSFSWWLNPDMGWHLPYPETTGYLLPTLIDWRHRYDDFGPMGRSCAQWLVDCQHRDGWWHAGLYKKLGPSVFNTAVIAQGILKAHSIWDDYSESLEAAYDWLLDQLDDQGEFHQFGYRGHHFPTYYTRVAWSMIEGGLHMNKPELLNAGDRILEQLRPRFKKDSIARSGFYPNKAADLHTVAYALRGWIESMNLLGRESNLVDGLLAYFEASWPKSSRWPARLWPDDHSFVNPTGEAQMALVLLRSGKRPDFIPSLIEQLISYQKQDGPAKGGFPGSVPFWKGYMPLRYPNWAAKFYLDLVKEIDILNSKL